MYTVIVIPLYGEQVIRQFQHFSEAYACMDEYCIAFFADNNLKSIEMRYNNEKI